MANLKEIREKRKRQCSKLVEISKDIVRQAFNRFKPEDLGITWTGGKDSTLSLWIIRQVCLEKGIPIPRAMIIGEGDEFWEIDAFVEKIKKEALKAGKRVKILRTKKAGELAPYKIRLRVDFKVL